MSTTQIPNYYLRPQWRLAATPVAQCGQVFSCSSLTASHGQDDGSGPSADHYFPGSAGHGHSKHQRRGGGGRPCKCHRYEVRQWAASPEE